MERRISAGILAGGKSKRMGEDKARLWHGGETFLAHLLRELREFDEVLLSVEDRRAWADAPCRVVEDQPPGISVRWKGFISCCARPEILTCW